LRKPFVFFEMPSEDKLSDIYKVGIKGAARMSALIQSGSTSRSLPILEQPKGGGGAGIVVVGVG
jgi:hypothetical protein